MRGTDRGVSDMIAFVIVFSLIITSVGITYTFGYSTLTDYQENEQKRNAERAFVALSDNIGDIESTHVEARSGELRLSGGTLSVENETDVTVHSPTWNLSNGSKNSLTNRSVGSFVYEYEGTQISYENGAVFRQDGDGRAIMLSEPEYRCGESYAMVSVVEVQTSGGALSADGTAQIRAESGKSSGLRYPENRTGTKNNATVENVSVTVESDKPEAWSDYFEDDWDVSGTGNERTFTCEPDSGDTIDVYVRVTIINIDYFT
ncbi:DUF7289 family protein [Halostella litorea]|uniref:DUF7289 family protein n=1 Tax=Halostella litorea TaxID=2528831 RepID=UPI001092CE15|nr:hypothetical protein [Halostella litorea]